MGTRLPRAWRREDEDGKARDPMNCLNDGAIQMVADGEADDQLRQHAASCQTGGERVRRRREQTGAMADVVNARVDIPAEISQRVERAIVEGSSQGATRLRLGEPSDRLWRRSVW